MWEFGWKNFKKVGKNKLIKYTQIERFENVVQAPYEILQHEDFYLKGKWGGHFFKNSKPIILELGCGKGEYTVELAEKNPHFNYIGVDIKGARMFVGAKLAIEKNLINVAFLRTNIEAIDRFFGVGEIAEIWLTFPDPQMKKNGKRLTSTFFLNLYRAFLKTSGTIHLKTDSNFQFIYTSALVRLNGFEILAETGNLYESEIQNETLAIKTFYEKQWLSRGITIKYIAFKLNNKEFTEPEIEVEKDGYRSFGRRSRDF